MKFNAPLPVWIAAVAVIYGFFSLPIDETVAIEGPAGTASVIDGDTLEVHGKRIRLHAADAPEGNQTCKRAGEVWRCGQVSAMALSEKIGRNPVRCVQVDIDRYKRVVARCYLGDEDLAEWLVSQGLAVAYRQYGKAYVPAEEQARASRRGIWAGEFVMPWDWRKGVRE